MILRGRTSATLTLLIAALGTAGTAPAQTSPEPSPAAIADQPLPEPDLPSPPPPGASPAEQPASSGGGLISDIKLYFTAPLRWDARQWAWFGGALVAIGASHHYDSQVRTHFVKNLAPGQTAPSDDLQDIAPTVGVLLATWGFATLSGSDAGRRETWTMLEAAGLSTVTAYALKYSVRRQGPDQTSDSNAWEKSGGRSFPSEHATAAFAVGTVLAESGNDDYRWLRRLLGYGLGVGTSYLRLKHNAHWLSDTVAGAALGAATAHFTMNHAYRNDERGGLAVVPVEGGAMLTYRISLE